MPAARSAYTIAQRVNYCPFFQGRDIGPNKWREIRTLVFTPDGKRLIAGDQGVPNRVWAVPSWKPLRPLGENERSGGDIVLSPDGFTYAVHGNYTRRWLNFGEGVEILLVDMRTDQVVGKITGSDKDSFRTFAFSPDGKILAVFRIERRQKGSNPGPRGLQIVLFEVATLQEVLRFDTPAWISVMMFIPGGRTLITAGGRDGRTNTTFRIWDISIGKEIAGRAGHTSEIESLALSPDGQTLASGSADGTILLWKKTWPPHWVPREAVQLNREQQQAAWVDLASRDAARAYRSAGLLLRDPSQAVSLMRKRLRPAVPKTDPRLIARLIADLDSDDFAVREKAQLGLKKEGEEAEFALRLRSRNIPRSNSRGASNDCYPSWRAPRRLPKGCKCREPSACWSAGNSGGARATQVSEQGRARGSVDLGGEGCVKPAREGRTMIGASATCSHRRGSAVQPRAIAVGTERECQRGNPEALLALPARNLVSDGAVGENAIIAGEARRPAGPFDELVLHRQ